MGGWLIFASVMYAAGTIGKIFMQKKLNIVRSKKLFKNRQTFIGLAVFCNYVTN